MPEITPDLSDTSRCVSVHWSLPVQCVLPRSHADVWHEAWHPQSGNRMRYRRTLGVFVTEELHDGAWHDLGIPAPGAVCGEPHSSKPGVFCQLEHGKDGLNENRWNHFSLTSGCRYSWNTPHAKALSVEQLTADVGALRALVEELHAALTQSENDLTGARLALWEEEQETRRLREERHSTNEALDDAVKAIREKDERIAELEAAPLAWAERLDAKSLDNLLITLGTATDHEPISGAIAEIHEVLTGFRQAVGGRAEEPPAPPPARTAIFPDGKAAFLAKKLSEEQAVVSATAIDATTVDLHVQPASLDEWEFWQRRFHVEPGKATHRGSFATATGTFGTGLRVLLTGLGVGAQYAAARAAGAGESHVVDYAAPTTAPECVDDCPGCETDTDGGESR